MWALQIVGTPRGRWAKGGAHAVNTDSAIYVTGFDAEAPVPEGCPPGHLQVDADPTLTFPTRAAAQEYLATIASEHRQAHLIDVVRVT